MLGRETLVGLAILSEAIVLRRLVDVVCKQNAKGDQQSRVLGLAERAPGLTRLSLAALLALLGSALVVGAEAVARRVALM